MDEFTRQYYQDMAEPTMAETIIGLAIIGLGVWAMKAISDANNPDGKKETWFEWLTRGVK